MLETWDGRSLGAGVALVLDERRKLALAEPWAIAQLLLNEADYEKLLGWARQSDGATIASLIARTDRMRLPSPAADLLPSIEACVGLLLLAVCSESVRRDGSTYAVWPCIAKRIGSMRHAEALFTAHGGATYALKSALHCASQQFDMLGGDFTDQRTNRWYRLLLLQGGIPDSEIVSLARWLDAPHATFLTGDLQRASPAFGKAWRSLERYRRQTATRDAVRRDLAMCPFFRSVSTDAVLDAAVAGLAPLDAGSDLGREAFDATLTLKWEPSGAPHVLLAPNFTNAERLGRRVRLWIDGSFHGTYRQTAEGRFTCAAGDTIELPIAERWLLTFEGFGDEPERLETTVDLFDDGSDTTVCFDSNGARCAPGAQSVRYVLAREPVEGEGVRRTTWFDAPGFSLTEVDATSRLTTCFGAEIWPPVGVRAIDGDMLSALRISHAVCGEQVGEISLTLELPPTVRVKAGRIGGGQLVVEPSGTGEVATLRGLVTPSAARPQLALTLTLEVSGRIVQRTLRFSVFTAASLDGHWLAPTSTVEAALLRIGALRVTLGSEYVGHDARFRSLGSTTSLPDQRACRIDVAGYGEPLEVYGQAPWNEGPGQRLVGKVVDHGDVVGHEVHSGELRVTLRGATTPGVHDWLLVWPRHGAPEILLPRDGDVETDTLRMPWRGAPPRAIGWCHRTACRGASWADDWSEGLDSTQLSPDTLVALIRVLCLPVLADPHVSRVARVLRDLDIGAALSAATCDGNGLTVEAEDGPRHLLPAVAGSDRGHWSSVARALLLRIRIATPADGDALSEYAQRIHPQQALAPGESLSPEQRDALTRWFDHYVSVLRQCGAVHPRDALVVTPHKNRPASIANRMAHEYRDLNETELYRERKETPAVRRARLARARDLETARLLRRLSSTPQTQRDALIGAARELVPDSAVTDGHLLAALLDDAFLRIIQLTLIDDIAFPSSK